MHLARFPGRFLAHLPTPLERLDRLSAELADPAIWIKRDDCKSLSTRGNKTRKLEFLMAEAQLEAASMVINQGATQSTHARQTAAFAAKFGMACHTQSARQQPFAQTKRIHTLSALQTCASNAANDLNPAIKTVLSPNPRIRKERLNNVFGFADVAA